MRLDRFLSNAGIGSRKEVKKLIKCGRIKVNNKIIRHPAYYVNEEETVFLDDERVIPYHNVYIVMNKPEGFTCSKSEYEPNIFEFLIHPYLDKLHIAGRLDKDVEGLIIITNDGQFTHKVISPKSKVEKEYHVEVEGILTDKMINKVEKGIVLKNGMVFAPAKIKQLSDGMVSLVITEGKYHEVKYIIAAIGLVLKRMRRVRIGNLRLDEFNLKKGQWKEIPRKKALKALEGYDKSVYSE
ncbi:rRNA pseudouridine synthase [Thermosipho ferrireducens]|uniref:rRNA pseudouridine synthase n=1 Tax=Thermosipho ferrireducens TaxID=2571116 RepID=A0ABX7S8S9_9BACT|nr:pseudouridine synthase [Thermosipho ferrireducens]QTA38318.1 rRNA pseudouridine synthase [Thermosipho ferrireducens]